MQNLTHTRIIYTVFGGLVLGASLGAADETSTAVAELQETALTGQKAEPPEFTAEDANTVDAIELQQWSANDLEDVFKTTLSVHAAGGRPQTQDIFIRGIQTTQASVTIDGAPQSGAIFYHAGSGGNIEPELLKSVEVSAGTGSALNGPGALAGALSYETKDGFDMLREGETIGALLKASYFSSGEGGYKLSASGYGLISENWSYLASIGYSDFGNYEDGDGNEVIDSEYERRSAFAKIAGQLTDAQTLKLSYEYLEDQGKGGNRINIAPEDPSDQNNYQERNTATVQYDINPLNNDWVDIESTVYFTERSLTGDDIDSSIQSIGLDLRNTSLLGDIEWTYGSDYRVDTHKTTKIGGKDTGKVLGFYTQAEWDVTSILTLSAGARYDRYQLEDRFGVDVDNDGFSPNGTVILRPVDGLELHATYAQAMRGAYPGQAFFDSMVQDPDMKAEESENIEFGFEYNFQNFYLGANVFQLEIDDVINPSYNRSTGWRSNIGKFKSKGYEIFAGAQFGNLQLRAGVIDTTPEVETYEGSTTDQSSLMNNYTGRAWTANAEYKFENLNLSAGWNLYYVESVTSDSGRSVSEKKPYAVHDAFVRWSPAAIDGLTLNLTVSNLFDRHYYDQATFAYQNGYAATGREIGLSFSYQF
ncbi:TonB-dependent receptor domain-containing protein [Coraliomargarita parva]|uniref:TonB-dependent receptor domain-containing protein n=1 Tax=Coraliomargarita parva TaxID=3014050 RepID=UPI0022B5A558|nr:TonB-dependent receptor [Coraliomargarita parva]